MLFRLGRRCLSPKKPEESFASAAELADALRSLRTRWRSGEEYAPDGTPWSGAWLALLSGAVDPEPDLGSKPRPRVALFLSACRTQLGALHDRLFEQVFPELRRRLAGLGRELVVTDPRERVPWSLCQGEEPSEQVVACALRSWSGTYCAFGAGTTDPPGWAEEIAQGLASPGARSGRALVYHSAPGPDGTGPDVGRAMPPRERFQETVLEDCWNALRHDPDLVPSQPPCPWAVSRTKTLALLLRYLSGAEAHTFPVILTGQPGVGKSHLLAVMHRALRVQGPAWQVVSLSVGRAGGSLALVLLRLARQLSCPLASLATPGASLRPWLAGRTEGRVVLLVDTVEQLGQVSWLPDQLGSGVRAVLAAANSVVPRLREQWPASPVVEVPPLERDDVSDLVRWQASCWQQHWAPEVVEGLARLPAAGNPLYLESCLRELHALVGWQVNELAPQVLPELARRWTGVTALFDWLLEKLEGAYGLNLVRLWCTTLAAAPGRWTAYALAEKAHADLGEAAGRQSWHVERVLKPYLREHEGKLAFAHRPLEETVSRRYAFAPAGWEGSSGEGRVLASPQPG